MAKAKKLPSGSWRTQESKVINGRVVRRSFTVSPLECGGNTKEASRKAKNLSELNARAWKEGLEDLIYNGPTVRLALDDYISDRSRVLSPSTIRGYSNMIPCFDPIADILVSDLKSPDLQRLINDMALDVKTKTIKNRIGFLLSALDYAGCDKKFKIRYPQNNSRKVQAPETDEVYVLLSDCGEEMQPVLSLAAFGGLRRSEICGLRFGDVSRDLHLVYIRGSMVLGVDGYIYKPFPKNNSSIRSVELPAFVFDLLPSGGSPDDFLFDLTPAAISDRFARLAKRNNIDTTFHGLRHFAASFRSDLGIPTKYIEEFGGWAPGSKILPSHYDNTLASSRRKFLEVANGYIEKEFKTLLQKSV